MAEISGQCTLDGSGVQGATVYLLTSTGVVEDTTTTDSNGDYSFDAPAGTYHVVAEYDDGDADLSDYSGATGSFDVQSETALEGTYSLEMTSDWSSVGHDSATVERGNTYRCRIQTGADTGNGGRFLIGVQDPANAIDDCYTTKLDVANNEVVVEYWSGGTNQSSNGTNISLDGGTTYLAELDYGETGTSDNITGRILNTDGTELGSVPITDDTHTGGTYGFYADNPPVYWDDVQENPNSGGSTSGFISDNFETSKYNSLSKPFLEIEADNTMESFESGDLSGWNDVGDVFTVVQDSSMAADGDYYAQGGYTSGAASELHDTGAISERPSRGDTIEFYVWTTDPSSARTRAYLFFGDDYSTENYYSLDVYLDNGDQQFYLWEIVDGTYNGVDGQTAYNEDIQANTVYRVELDWGDPTMSITLENTETGATVASGSGDSTEYADSSGDFMFAASNDADTEANTPYIGIDNLRYL